MPENDSLLTARLGPLPVWVWGAAGGAILYLLSRGRGGGGPALSAPLPTPVQQQISAEEAAANALMLQEAQARFQQQRALEELELRTANVEFALFEARARQEIAAAERQRIVEEAVSEKFRRMGARGVKCPKGDPRIDPTTGQIICRTKQRKTIFNRLEKTVKRGVELYLQTQTPAPLPGVMT